MTTHRVGLSLVFTAEDGDGTDFEAVLDRFYEELLATEGREADIIDPDIAASLEDLTADVEMDVEAESVIDAQVKAAIVVRTALHCIGAGTPGWEAIISAIMAPARAELLDA